MSAGEQHRVRLRGSVAVGLAPARAIELFTPSGERRWDRWLADFAAGYEAFLDAWSDAIAATLASA